MKKIQKRISISAFNKSGKLVDRFKSIHSFLKFVRAKYKFHSYELLDLRKGALIYRYGHIIGWSKKHTKNYINPLRCVHFKRKNHSLKINNVNRLKDFNDRHQLIVTIDNNLKILGYHRGTIESISKKLKVSSGTIKASLHRSAKRFIDSGYDSGAIYFVYLRDLPRFIKNAEKTCRYI